MLLPYFLAPPAGADEPAASPPVVELFTSQSCYSCPPAEALLGELAKRDDVIALEFHVDYWDDLVYGAAGRWKDRFSAPEYTARQRGYAGHVGKNRVYTPQVVVDGRMDVVGNRRSEVLETIETAWSERAPGPRLTVSPAAGGGLALSLDGAAERPAALWLIAFDREHETIVEAGENKGKKLANIHVVTEIRQIAEWQGGPLTLAVEEAPAGENRGCAILLQEDGQGPILAASYCPAAPGS